ncbi:Oidioi.mRNA.OKI2018_I69.chr1.g56.t1.cds [Oikopleura dioica]|uniref:Beta-1,4-galactosyltransferase n=1 Tax=Oikopleura dioica TaxID=34765 RepID=A0ABN7SMV9_OIKDI|nr:Oidioi.mRNA.OKI2018_I69.chr1.g56.t1.cds [Oikopleura dioica]
MKILRRLLARRRVILMLLFLGAIVLTYTDSVRLLREQEESNRAKRDLEKHPLSKAASPQSNVLSMDHKVPLTECAYNSPKLIGPLKTDPKYIPEWDEIEVGETKNGGCWQPSDCAQRQNVAIIIPYKNREEHLRALLNTLHPILQRQNTAYCIYVGEQHDDGRFNKGAVMNSAFKEVLKEHAYDCVIFHDVDMLPEDDRNIYQCESNPVHLSPLIDKFDYKPYGTDFGGITMLRPEHFIAANGMSNLFWGWGREDDDMQFRVGRSPFNVTKPVNYEQARYKMIPHQHAWIFRNFKIRDSTTDVRFLPPEYLVKYKERSTVEGLTSVNYKNLGTDRKSLFTHLDLELRELVVDSLKTEFISSGSSQTLIDTTKKECSYIKMENTRVCEEYGHTMVLKYLRKLLLSYDDAVKKCDELGYMCTGFAEDSLGKYRLREVTQLLSSDNTPQDCNTKGKHIFHKSCPGDQSFIQVSQDLTIPISDQLTPPNYAFTHRLQE